MKKAANEKSGSPLSGRLWKWLIVLAALCLAAYLVIWYMPHSEEVSWSGTAVEYRMDDMDFAADHEAVIQGTYIWNRAGKRTFEGSFWIDGLDIDPDGRTKLTLESKKSHYDEGSNSMMLPDNRSRRRSMTSSGALADRARWCGCGTSIQGMRRAVMPPSARAGGLSVSGRCPGGMPSSLWIH